MKRFLTYSVYFLFGVLMACSEAITPTPLTYTKVFTGDDHKSWSIKYFIFKQTGKGDQTFGLASCSGDDKYIFYAGLDRKYQIDNNSTTCSPDAGISYPLIDTWSFVNATATLTIIIPELSDSALPFFVRSVNDKQMVLEIFVDQENTTSYQIYFTQNQN